jgi:hypothetical protein
LIPHINKASRIPDYLEFGMFVFRAWVASPTSFAFWVATDRMPSIRFLLFRDHTIWVEGRIGAKAELREKKKTLVLRTRASNPNK